MSTLEKNPALLSKLNGKTAIITGGANGIGAHTVRFLHSKGANVVIADLEAERKTVESLISSLSNSSQALFQATNVLKWDEMKALFRTTIAEFGRVDILVANAGIMESTEFFSLPALETDSEPQEPLEAYKVLDINLKGVMNALKLAMHHMRSNPVCTEDSSRGSIVLLSSLSGYFGGSAVVSYVTSKHGISGLMRASQKVANSISVRVNAVAPFFTPTHITSSFSERWMEEGLPQSTPQDVAWAIAQTLMDPTLKGKCCIVAGEVMKEIEGPRDAMIQSWMGPEIMNFIVKGGRLYDELGGYPLPQRKE